MPLCDKCGRTVVGNYRVINGDNWCEVCQATKTPSGRSVEKALRDRIEHLESLCAAVFLKYNRWESLHLPPEVGRVWAEGREVAEKRGEKFLKDLMANLNLGKFLRELWEEKAVEEGFPRISIPEKKE